MFIGLNGRFTSLTFRYNGTMTQLQPKTLEQREGLVIKALSGFYTVRTPQGDIVSHLAGRLKQQWQSTDIATVGDRVMIHLEEDGTGIIQDVLERQTALARARPSAGNRQLSSDRQQVLVANLDQVFFVLAAKTPSPNTRKLDRFLVVAEWNEIEAIIVVNKIDLVQQAKMEKKFAVYEEIGYTVIYTSAKEGIGIEAVQQLLPNKISVFTGSSGVGKSSLLNAVQPGLGLMVSAVSQATGKGMHTTRHAEMFPVEGGGYVADTPGIRGLALFDIEPTEIDAYFREIAPLVPHCQFSDCTHRHEPKCAVRTAVKEGLVSEARYDSYLRLRQEHESLDQALYG